MTRLLGNLDQSQPRTDTEDRRRWLLVKNGEFLVKSSYELLATWEGAEFAWVGIWKPRAHAKVLLFVRTEIKGQFLPWISSKGGVFFWITDNNFIDKKPAINY